MKATHIKHSAPMRLMAVFLCALVIFGLYPLNAFAWPSGHSASSWYGATVTGSDGQAYYHPAPWSFMSYHADGTVSYGTYAGGSAYEHFMLTDGSGASRWVYCVESGAAFNNADNVYSASGTNGAYMNRLPATAQYGIKLASIYGAHPGEALPVSGINMDDWYMATQVIIWEYQQQIRTDALSRHANGIIGANQLYSIISGRPAERAYNWILGKIASHSTLPSFSASTAAAAPTHELKWDVTDKVYRLTLTDTNNLNIDLQRLSGSGVSVTRSGNKYTFTSSAMIMNAVTFQYRKDVPIAGEMLIWGRPGHQTMLTGAEDPVSFYLKIKTETYGTARIIKTSEDGIVSGISFTITGTDVLGNTVSETVTTGANGRVDKQLLPGTYLVRENPVDRYVTPASQYITIESGQTATVSFHNVLKKFRVHLVKSDADTGYAQGDASLAGVVYGVYQGSQLVDTYTTGTDGSFLTHYYICGTDWTIREITPSEGYLLDTAVHTVGADPKLYQVELNTTENRVTEKVIYGNIRLIKHTDDWDSDVPEDERTEDGNAGMAEQPEAGAVFEIYLRSAGSYEAARPAERDTLTTDADGMAQSKMLPYGRYTVHQVSGAYGKALVPDFTVFIRSNGYTYSYILNNDAITGRVRVEKRDAETGKIIPLSGTGFKVKDLKTGGFVEQTVWYPNPVTLDTYYTSDEGWLMLPEELPMGNYELHEVAAPYGYVLGSEAILFTIDGSEAVVTVVQRNMPQKGQITITKTGEVYTDVAENEGLYQPVYEVMGLPGATYDIIADEDIYTADGTVRAAKDSVIETLVTGVDATATSGLLYLGKYRLEETSAPVGMVRNTEPVHIELTYAGQEVEVTQTDLGLYDERQKVALDLIKQMKTDKVFGIGFDDEYKSVTFGLYAAVDITALGGSAIIKDGLIETVSITPIEGEPGHYTAAFAADLPFGSYYVQEMATDRHYILNSKQYLVNFAYEGQDTAIVSITANDGKAIENEIIRGDISGVKRGEDPEGGEPSGLAGALIGLFRPDDEIMDEDTALLTTVTAENGAFAFEDIPFGHWVIHEIAAPEGYTVSPEYHHIYIGVDGQVIEIRIDDTLIRGGVQLMKTEAVGEAEAGNPFMRRLSGAVFELYADTDGNKEFDEAADTLLCELDEQDAGLHEKRGLLYGGYFVKEKTAPEGYTSDDKAYYFEIAKDGDMAIIENAGAGQGFVNKPITGGLRIVKDSSDGRRDGFAFEVKATDGTYREVFTTDGSGVIEIGKLRIGTYTVTEVENRASRAYIVPDGVTAEIVSGRTAEVKFFNEKKVVPEPLTTETGGGKPVPQTSDDARVYLLAATLAAASILGALAAFCFARQRKRAAGHPAMRRNLYIAAVVVCMAAVGASALLLASALGEYGKGADAYEKIAAAAHDPAPADADGSDAVDFTVLSDLAPYAVAWITSSGTAIDYPVMEAEDNGYYLRHLPDGSESTVGSLFIDYENDAGFTDRNTVIYGHNMTDGSMFASLNEYRDQAYFDAHPVMRLITLEQAYRLELFSAFEASPGESGTDTSPWALDWTSGQGFEAWLTAMKDRSLVSCGITPMATDRIVTLSTCTDGGRTRFIVMGRLVSIR